MRKLYVVVLSAALFGCASVGGNSPPLIQYSVEQQQQAAKELRALPKGSQIGRMIVDYGKTRKAIWATR